METLCVPDIAALDVAFDGRGNLWVVNTSSLQEYSALQLAALRGDAFPTPVLTITSSALADTVGLAFDPFGNLWAAGGSGFQEFSAAQLTAGGSQTPKVTLKPCTGSAGSCQTSPLQTARLAFDAAGNLWSAVGVGVGSSGTGEETAVYELSHASIGASGSPTPAAQLKLPAPAPTGVELVCPWNDLAFDPSGNLWVAYFGVYFEFTEARLSSSNPSPALAINLYGYNEATGSDAITTAFSTLAVDQNDDVFAFAGNGPFKTMTPAEYLATTPSSTSDSGPAAFAITAGPYHP
jgi:hypothetical protein